MLSTTEMLSKSYKCSINCRWSVQIVLPKFVTVFELQSLGLHIHPQPPTATAYIPPTGLHKPHTTSGSGSEHWHCGRRKKTLFLFELLFSSVCPWMCTLILWKRFAVCLFRFVPEPQIYLRATPMKYFCYISKNILIVLTVVFDHAYIFFRCFWCRHLNWAVMEKLLLCGQRVGFLFTLLQLFIKYW